MERRAWLTPAELRAYTAFADVRKRSPEQLGTDILRAQEFVTRYTGNAFSPADYAEIPQTVKTACLLLAEAYAHNAQAAAQTIRKETFDEYSYEAENNRIDPAALGLDALLGEYVLTPKARAEWKLRRL